MVVSPILLVIHTIAIDTMLNFNAGNTGNKGYGLKKLHVNRLKVSSCQVVFTQSERETRPKPPSFQSLTREVFVEAISFLNPLTNRCLNTSH